MREIPNWRQVALTLRLRVASATTLGDDYGVRTESEAMLAALDEAGVRGPLDIIGHSYGGLIALDFALLFPKRVRTLILSEPPTYFLLDPAERALPAIREWAEMSKRHRRDQDITEDDLESFLHEVGAVPRDVAPRSHPKWAEWTKYRRSLRIGGVVFSYETNPAALEAFDRPVMLIRGNGTSAAHEHFNRQLEKHFPRAQTLDLPGGHLAIIHSKDRSLPEIRKFIGRAP